MPKRKIMIIVPIAFGYTQYIYEALLKHQNIETTLVFIENKNYSYRNFFHRLSNFLHKTFLKVNLKKRQILDRIRPFGQQDEIFIIRPDLLDDYVLKSIKKKTKVFTAFYFDSIGHIPRKKYIISFFDRILSFDKVDVKKYGFEFCTNYIFDQSESIKNHDFLFFNISSHDDDYRFDKLVEMAKYIKAHDWSFNFISIDIKNKNIKNDLLTIQKDIIPVQSIKKQLLKSKILVEFQRENQIGLSFRVFEALGYRKKLITTNTDVVNYDFYNPQNILVLDPNNLHIPKSFVESPYVDVPDHILDPYHIDNWVKKVFSLED